MENPITLVDRGRALQLSTSRITVHDLVPNFQAGCSHSEIMGWLPSLSPEEIRIVEHDDRQHKDEPDEHERRVQVYRAEPIRCRHSASYLIVLRTSASQGPRPTWRFGTSVRPSNSS